MNETDISPEYDTLAMSEVLRAAEVVVGEIYYKLKLWQDGQADDFQVFFPVGISADGMDVNDQAHEIFQNLIGSNDCTDGAVDFGGKKLFVGSWQHEGDTSPSLYLYASDESTIEKYRRVASA